MKNVHSKFKCSLVTGGAGFLGTWLCEALLNKGQSVICLDNLSTGSMENIAPFFSNPNFSFVKQDVTEPFFFDVDAIYHLACPAAPKYYQKDPLQTLMTCFQGTYHALEAAQKAKAALLFASTSEVYGDPKQHPQKEGYHGNVNTLGERSCYDEGKRCSETLCLNFHQTYKTPIRIARIFNTFGPKMSPEDGRLIPNFIIYALNRQPLTIFGDGKQTRSLCFVKDLIEGLIKLMEADGSWVGPVNLGNPYEMTVLEIADKILKLTGSTSSLAFLPALPDDPKQRCPNISFAKQILGWEPRFSIEEGLKETIVYFSKKLGKLYSIELSLK